MWGLKNHRMGFDPWGLGLFLLIMIPNFVWFAFPAPNDVLRGESVVPVLDAVGQIFQIGIVAALCGVANSAGGRPMKRGFRVGAAVCVILYFVGWAAYYAGIAGAAVVFDLCVATCGAFALFALGRKNAPALLATAGFTVCHLISTFVNFIL